MATRLIAPLYQVRDLNGNPGVGYKLYFYEVGTTTPKDTYSDIDLSVPNSNPIIADENGRFGNVFGATKDAYKMILKNDVDEILREEDPIDIITYNINSFTTRPAQHWGTTTGDADDYKIKPDPSITEYTDDLLFSITIHIDCNATPTLAVFQEGTVDTYLGALDFKKYDTDGSKIDIKAGDLLANETYLIYIDGTDAVVFDLPKNATSTFKGVSLLNKPITLANNSIDPNNDIDFSAGNFVFDDFSGEANLPSLLTKRLDAPWAEGDGQGGLDAGTKANDTWYHWFVIYNPTTGISDGIGSTSSTSPTMPPGYTKKRRRGAVLTDGSGNIRTGIWRGKNGEYFIFDVPIIDINEVPNSADAQLRTISAPLGIETKAMLVILMFDDSVSSTTQILFTSPLITDTAPTTNLFTINLIAVSSTGENNSDNTFDIITTNTSSQIRFRMSKADADIEVKAITKGYIDTSL